MSSPLNGLMRGMRQLRTAALCSYPQYLCMVHSRCSVNTSGEVNVKQINNKGGQSLGTQNWEGSRIWENRNINLSKGEEHLLLWEDLQIKPGRMKTLWVYVERQKCTSPSKSQLQCQPLQVS